MGLSIVASKPVIYTDANIAAQSRVSQSILVRLVEYIRGVRGDGKTSAEIVTGGEIEPRVSWIASQVKRQIEKITIRATTAEICPEGDAELAESGVKCKRARMCWSGEQVVARLLHRIKLQIGGGKHASVVVGVSSCGIQPGVNFCFGGKDYAPGAGAIRIEKISKAGWRTGNAYATRIAGGWRRQG